MPKPPQEAVEQAIAKPPLGISPGVLAQRDVAKQNQWCAIPDIEFDHCCDPNNPKTVTYKDILLAASTIRKDIPKSPILRSKSCAQFEMELNYKLEIFHTTGSYHERGALFSLSKLNEGQRKSGVITASLGNWAMALAFYANRLKIPLTVVLPICALPDTIEKCQDYGALVILFGDNLGEAKRQAFIILTETGQIYLNGYDHPHVIAGAGSIGIEIIEQLPSVDAILVPVGGGGIIAGIAAAVKHKKPEVLGVEPDKCCSFFKAMDNEQPYQTVMSRSIANSLAVPKAGCNAFHTARSLIDKIVLVDDDWIVRAILHLLEEEKLVLEGAGATSLAPLMTIPSALSELKGKTVVCVLTGGNIYHYNLVHCLERAKAIEGRIIKLTVTLPADDTQKQLKVLSMIANVGVNIINYYVERAWLHSDDIYTIYLTVICETRDLAHACSFKKVMDRIFPNICDFLEEPYSPVPICTCYPKKCLPK